MTPVNTHGDEIKIPKTITPLGVWIWNAIIFGAFWTVLPWEFGCPTFWSTILTLLGIVISVHYNGIAIEGVDYHGFLLFNSLTKKRRVIFPGLHPKLFWEGFEEGSLTSLRRIIESEGEQSLPTNDPAENMVAHLTIHKRVNVSGTPQEAASNFIRFHSISDADLAKIVRKEIVRKLSAFYSTNEMEALLNANAIEESVLSLPAVVDKIREMQYRWGIIIEIVLDSSNPDDATKAMKRTPAIAEALSTAIQKLVAGGMDPELARRAALILDPNTDYTEERFDLNISAPDLKNLQHASFMGFGEGKDKKGGKKK